jgi:hypothetical protein
MGSNEGIKKQYSEGVCTITLSTKKGKCACYGVLYCEAGGGDQRIQVTFVPSGQPITKMKWPLWDFRLLAF